MKNLNFGTEKENNKQAENSEPAKNKSQENLDKTVTNSTKSSPPL